MTEYERLRHTHNINLIADIPQCMWRISYYRDGKLSRETELFPVPDLRNSHP